MAGVVLNRTTADGDDSIATNAVELALRCVPPLLGRVDWQAERLEPAVNWRSVAERDFT